MSKSGAVLEKLFAPTPAVARGESTHFCANRAGDTLFYHSLHNVVMRNVADPLKAEVYSEHAHDVSAVRVSPSGFYCASGDVTGKVRIWSVDNVEHILKIELPVLAAKVRDMAWTEDSKRLIVVGEGRDCFGAAFLWDSGSSCGTIEGHAKTINTVDIKQNRPYRAVTGGVDFVANFFNGAPFKLNKPLKDHTRFVNCARFSPDGTKFITVSSDKSGIMYDGKEGTELGRLDASGAHTAGIYSVAWSADSKKVVTASADKTVKVWDAETLQAETMFAVSEKPGTEHQQLGVCWAGEQVISLSLGGDLYYHDAAAPGKPKRVVHGHSKFVTAVAYDAAHGHLFSGDQGGKIVRWNAESGETALVTPHGNMVTRIAVSGGKLYTAGIDDTIRIAELGALDAPRAISIEGLPSDMAVAAKSGAVVVATNKSVLVIHDGGVVCTIPTTWENTAVAVTPDGATAVVGGKDAKLRVYKLTPDGALSDEKTVSGHRAEVTAIDVSADGKHVAATDKKNYCMVWSAETWEPVVESWCHHTAPPTSVQWSADNQHLVTGSLDSSFIVWDVADTSKRIKQARAHPLGVLGVTWLSTERIATVGNDGCMRTWNLQF